MYENKRVKSENDKTEAVESEQVLKVQNDLKKLIKEYGSVRLKVGKVKYDVDDFRQVPGRPKADMIFTLKGKPVIFVSGHFNNFELLAMKIEMLGINLSAIYRPLNNFF